MSGQSGGPDHNVFKEGFQGLIMPGLNLRFTKGPTLVIGLAILAALVLLVYHATQPGSAVAGKSFEVLQTTTFSNQGACEASCGEPVCAGGRQTAPTCLPSQGRYECVPIYRDCTCCQTRCC